MSTIKDAQNEIESALGEIQSSRSIPRQLEGLRRLAPADSHPRVSFRYLGKDRKVREDASENYFDPARCEVVIRFEIVDEAEPLPSFLEPQGADDADHAHPTDTAALPALEQDRMRDLIRLLDRTERERDFVALTWFRDRVLAEQCAWAADPRTAGRALREAIDSTLLLTAQTPNPRNPLHPVTTVRLNRSHPEIRRAAPQGEPGFRPLKIDGASLSSTVLEQRR